MSLLSAYTNWLHTRWPAGTVERLPEVREDGSTNVPGLYVVGDLAGVPLLKISSDTGARVIESITVDAEFQRRDTTGDILDVAIVGAGVSGMAAALAAREAGLSYKVIEATEQFSTIANFPKAKPIYLYPTDMRPSGDLQFGDRADIKEGLLEELNEKVQEAGIVPLIAHVENVTREGKVFTVHLGDGKTLRAHRVVVGIGRSGNYRKLGVPGEDLDKVYNRLHDPKDFCGREILVVGGGDSALETAIALTQCGSNVTLSYRKPEFSRPKAGNIEKIRQLTVDPGAGSLRLMMASQIKAVREDEISVQNAEGETENLPNDVVFSMLGREAPLDFFRRSGVNIRGIWGPKAWVTFSLFLGFCVLMYHWKAGGSWLNGLFRSNGWFPFNLAAGDSSTLWGSVRVAMKDPGFYYSLAYCLCVVIFGVCRIRRRKTPYVKVQTLALMAIQVIPLFLLPYILLPWMGNNGVFESGVGQWFGDTFFPDGSYWRAFGFVLAWPLFIWNVFTEQPVWGWLILSLIQTFVVIPLIVYRWGKGAYCGWICSCGALAETLGDAHRHKMPHGPFWNRLNMVGQGVLFFALVLLGLRIVSWIWPGSHIGTVYNGLLKDYAVINYKYLVDLWFAGILGVGLYFHFSGRVWCRFACPLAALMHIYARFSQFRILTDKKKCISCNVCTSVCHQGIDIMNFANKGLPMADPECVRCSACVQSCPTGVLTFGRINVRTGAVLARDSLAASPVQMEERKQTAL